MSIISLPSVISWREASLELESNMTVTRSRSGREQRLINPGDRWSLSLTLSPMNEDEARHWRAFLMNVQGAGSEFLFGPVDYHGPSDYLGANARVAGAGQFGTQLFCDNVDPSSVILKAGEYFSVNNELKVMTSDAVSDGLGRVLLNFEPMLRHVPGDNTLLEFQSPKAKFRLENSASGWSYGHLGQQQIKSIQAYEVID